MSEAIAPKIEAPTRELKDGSGGNPQAIPLNLNDSPEAQPTSPTAEVVDQTVIDHEQLDLHEIQQRQAVIEETFLRARQLTESIGAEAQARLHKTVGKANESFDYAKSLAFQAFDDLMRSTDVNRAHHLHDTAMGAIRQAENSFDDAAAEVRQKVSFMIEQAESDTHLSKDREITDVDNQPFTPPPVDGQQVAIDQLCDWSISLADRVKSGAEKLADGLLQVAVTNISNEARIQVEKSLNWAIHQLSGTLRARAEAEDEVFRQRGILDPSNCFSDAMADVAEHVRAVHSQLVTDAEKQRNLSLQQIAETDSQTEVTQPPQVADSFESHQQSYQETVEQIHDDCAARLAEKITANQAAVTEASQALETARSVAHQVAEQAAIAAQTPEEVRLAYVDQLAPIEQAYMQSLANLSVATRAKFAFEKDNSLDEQGQAALEQAIQAHPAVVAHRFPQPTGGVV